MTQLVDLPVHLWTRDEYYKIADAGVFHQKRVELLEGQVIEMSPMGSMHAVAIAQATQLLTLRWAQTAHVRAQLPFVLGEHTELEPDLAVIAGRPQDYTQQHPSQALLIIEVAETSLAYDRGAKARAYARVGIADYWIINLVDQHLEVYRDPAIDPVEQVAAYLSRTILHASDVVTPLAQPQISLQVADLLP